MPRYLAIDFDAAGLSVATATLKGKALDLERVLVLPDQGLTLTPATAEALGQQLKTLLKEAAIKTAPVLLTVGRDRIILKEVNHPPSAPGDEPLVVRFQAVKELSDAPEDMVMDYLPLGSTPFNEKKALAVFVRKELVAAARLMCDTAGLKLAAMTPRPFALAASTRYAVQSGQVTLPNDAQSAVGMLAVSDRGGEFTVSRGQNILFTRAITAQAVRNDMTLIAEMKRNLTVYNTQQPQAPLQAILVPESPATVGASWAGFLAEELPLPVIGYDPLQGTPLSEKIPPAVRGRLVAPIGGLALKAENETLPINFAAPRQPRAERKTLSPKVLIGLVAAVAILGLIGTIAFLELNKADERVTARLEQKQQIDTELARLEPDSKRYEAAEEFRNREIVWLDELYDLATRVPDVDKVKVIEIDSNALAPPKKETPRATLPTAAAAPGATPSTGVPVANRPTTPAPKKELPVASMKIVIRSNDPNYPQRMSDDFSNDKFYAGVSKSKPNSQGDSKGEPTYVLNSLVLHRGADKYSRQLKAVMPKIEAAPPPGEDEAAGANPAQGFGVGFGGFNP